MGMAQKYVPSNKNELVMFFVGPLENYCYDQKGGWSNKISFGTCSSQNWFFRKIQKNPDFFWNNLKNPENSGKSRKILKVRPAGLLQFGLQPWSNHVLSPVRWIPEAHFHAISLEVAGVP